MFYFRAVGNGKIEISKLQHFRLPFNTLSARDKGVLRFAIYSDG